MVLAGEFADALFQAALIQGADLFEQNDGVLRQSVIGARKFDVSGKFGFVDLARNGRRYDRRGVLVANIVLHDEHRPYAALLAADYGT